jgi:hypothetical protein
MIGMSRAVCARRSVLLSNSVHSGGRAFSAITAIGEDTANNASNNRQATKILDECLRLRASVQVINDTYKGPLDKSNAKNTILPFVFLLGNHSSGKSSFINYVAGRKIQTAGVAPTDDTFTIIVPGPADVDRDGPAFIGDPDMGFGGLKSFGPQLIHHTQLKVRSNLAINDFMVVDTPGVCLYLQCLGLCILLCDPRLSLPHLPSQA